MKKVALASVLILLVAACGQEGQSLPMDNHPTKAVYTGTVCSKDIEGTLIFFRGADNNNIAASYWWCVCDSECHWKLITAE